MNMFDFGSNYENDLNSMRNLIRNEEIQLNQNCLLLSIVALLKVKGIITQEEIDMYTDLTKEKLKDNYKYIDDMKAELEKAEKETEEFFRDLNGALNKKGTGDNND